MMIANRALVALVVGLAVASFTSQASAQKMAKRDAAVAKCFKQAQAQYPDDMSMNDLTSRAAAYKSCMVAAGFTP